MTAPLILVTGSTDGIGKQTALELLRSGAQVIVHGRSQAKVDATVLELRRASGSDQISGEVCDFASLAAVRELGERLVQRYDAIDVLINNAGVFKSKRELTLDGYEATFAINHLAPFVLTHVLLPTLRPAKARVVNVSSGVHRQGRLDFKNLQGERDYDGYSAYALSKLGNVLFTVEFANRVRNSGVTVNALHPGVIATKLLRQGFGMGGGDSLAEGARTSVYLALAPELSGVTGGYYSALQPAPKHPAASDAKTLELFYETSAALAGITPLPRA